MVRSEYGIRLSDVRMDFRIEVPARSLDHAEEVVRWHNDPKNESCYEAVVVIRQIAIGNWEVVTNPPRKVSP